VLPLLEISKRVLVEVDANTPFIAGPLQVGRYHSLLIAPATANTVAKIVHGIADTLLTNAVAQTQKGEQVDSSRFEEIRHVEGFFR